jgi:hypothetical protein
VYKKISKRDVHRTPEWLTTPRDVVEHKHDTLIWVIIAEHESIATSSSDFWWQATHKPPTDGSEARGHKRSQLPSSNKRSSHFKSRTHTSPPADADPPLSPRLRWRGSPCVIVAKSCPRHSSSNFMLQNPHPRIHHALRSANIEGGIEATMTIQMQRCGVINLR